MMTNVKDLDKVSRCFSSMGRFMTRSNVMGSLILLNVIVWIFTAVVLFCVVWHKLPDWILIAMMVFAFVVALFTMGMYAYFASRRPTLLHSESWWDGVFSLLAASKGGPVLADVVDAECASLQPTLKDAGQQQLTDSSSGSVVEEMSAVLEAKE